MKNFIKKLLIPVVISSQFLLPFSGFAKERQVGKSKSNFYVGGSIGVYQGTEDMRKVYGKMLKLRGNIDLNLSKNFRLESALTYINKEKGPKVYNVYGEDMDVRSKIDLIGLEALVHYLVPTPMPTFYFGGGLTLMEAKEEVSFSSLYANNVSTFKASVRSLGPVFVFGVDVPINREKTKNIYAEFSKRSVKFKGILGETLDMGGDSFDVGMRLNFK